MNGFNLGAAAVDCMVQTRIVVCSVCLLSRWMTSVGSKNGSCTERVYYKDDCASSTIHATNASMLQRGTIGRRKCSRTVPRSTSGSSLLGPS